MHFEESLIFLATAFSTIDTYNFKLHCFYETKQTQSNWQEITGLIIISLRKITGEENFIKADCALEIEEFNLFDNGVLSAGGF